jgi:hypothetical protein
MEPEAVVDAAQYERVQRAHTGGPANCWCAATPPVDCA